jgi:ubiquinone/menaquinone biosynthesis C-methylase UbiE
MSIASTYHASDGAAYEIFLGRWTKELAPRLLDFAEFAPDGPLLDVGTGTGSLARAMATRWPSRRIVGLDISEPYVAYARAQTKVAQPEFQIGDAASLQFGNGTFAGVTAQLVLNFVPNAHNLCGKCAA